MKDSPIRILHFSPWYPNPNDPQLGTFVHKHVAAIAQHTHSTFTSFYRPSAPVSGKNEAECIAHPLSDLPAGSTLWEVRGAAWRFALIALRELWQRRDSTDYLHLHTIDRYGCLLSFAAHLMQINVVITEHWTGYRSGAFNQLPGWERFLRTATLNAARSITVVSPSLEEDLHRIGVRKPIHVVPNILQPAQQIKTSYAQPIQWVVIADLVDAQKNISGAMEAFFEVAAFGEILHIVGDGPDRNSLEQRVPVGFEGRVHFHGRWNNTQVLAEMHRFDVLLVNSRVETFSVVTAEAMSAGLCCIVTRSGGPEYLVDEASGVVIDVDRPKSLTAAMIRVRSELGERFQPASIAEGVRSKFSRDRVAEQFLAIYHGG